MSIKFPVPIGSQVSSAIGEQIERAGGRLIYFSATALSPDGAYFVQCLKHPDDYYERVWFNQAAYKCEEAMLHLVERVLRNCPFCKKEREAQVPSTRFPEGAEL